MQCGEYAAALEDLNLADTALNGSTDPLRVSQYAVIRLDCQIASGLQPDRTLVQRVQALTERSVHPLMLVRVARMQAVLALLDGDIQLATQAASRQADTARAAGLLEPLADAMLLLASVASSDDERRRLTAQALDLAEKQGFAELVQRAKKIEPD